MARVPISSEVERRVRDAARHRCGYCLSQQRYTMAKLTIEHIRPRSTFAPGDPAMHGEENLWLSCGFCNGHKSDKTHGAPGKAEGYVATDVEITWPAPTYL